MRGGVGSIAGVLSEVVGAAVGGGVGSVAGVAVTSSPETMKSRATTHQGDIDDIEFVKAMVMYFDLCCVMLRTYSSGATTDS